MQTTSPVRDASVFLARLSELTPREWCAVADAHAAAVGGGAPTTFTGRFPPAEPGMRAALHWLALPGRREAHTVLHEWLDALATPLFAAAGRDPAVTEARIGEALHLAERATLALLVSDALDRTSFERLYAPFAEKVPLASLRGGAAGPAVPPRP